MTNEKKINFFFFVYITICEQTDKVSDKMSQKHFGTQFESIKEK